MERPGLLTAARSGLRDIGYVQDLIREDYAFNDILSDGAVRRIDLAAFSQDPPSYRSACLGITLGEQEEGSKRVQQYKSVGAPQILAVNGSEIERWKMTTSGDPELLQKFPSDHIRQVLVAHRTEWGPEAISRAKSIGFQPATIQLDFIDIGLLPVIDSVAQDKLDRLLRDTLAATKAAYRENHIDEPNYPGLYRLIFRLIAAKLLSDRQQPGTWISDDPGEVIRAVEKFYFTSSAAEPVLEDPVAQEVAWKHIRHGFQFQNISVETLAHIYENTLVSPDMRKRRGIHSTPPEIAEKVVRLLPFEQLEPHERKVFEPFAGHAAFLVASLGRLRSLLPSNLTATGRHEYFVQMLSGMEADPFAREVSRLSLMLADYPNPDGWRLIQGDIFEDSSFSTELSRAQVVLCNPPFEAFTHEEKQRYKGQQAANKAVESIERVLTQPPTFLGYILPRIFISGKSYRSVRHKLIDSYENIEIIGLPDNAFAHSHAETILLMAHGDSKGQLHLQTADVRRPDYNRFVRTGEPSFRAEEELATDEAINMPALWLDPLQQVWRTLIDCPRLESIADIHRGVEYNAPFKDHKTELVSDIPRSRFEPGIFQVTIDFEPYFAANHAYLSMDPGLMKGNSYKLPWSEPKVIANAARIGPYPWTITAVPDYSGLVCYQNFHGIWPKNKIPVEAIAAILNGPVANAFISLRSGKRHNQKRIVGQIPIPDLSEHTVRTLQDMVLEYRHLRDQWQGKGLLDQPQDKLHRLMLEIDAELLTAYDLSPRLERDLLKFFSGMRRPGPIHFTGYYPSGFRPALPLRMLISKELEQATARRTLERLPVLRDREISEFVAAMDAE